MSKRSAKSVRKHRLARASTKLAPIPKVRIKMKPRGKPFTKGHQYGLATRFVKGVCPNPLGRARSKEIGEALRSRCAQVDPLDAAERTYAMEISDVWIAAALDGNVNAAAEIASRLEGRPATKLVVSDGDNLKAFCDAMAAKSLEYGPPEDFDEPQLQLSGEVADEQTSGN